MCSEEELGLKGPLSSSRFMPIHEKSERDIRKYHKKFICTDPKDMYIHGEYHSDEARLINMQFIRCRNETTHRDDSLSTALDQPV